MKTYFRNVKTIEDLKKLYHELVKKHHPDIGGDAEIMKEINAEFDEVFPKLKDTHKNYKGETYQATGAKVDHQKAAEYRRLILDLFPIILKLDGIKIEILGSWIWISGESYKHKNVLKASGFQWSAKKAKWYYNGLEKAKRGYKSYFNNYTELRDHWGATEIEKDRQQAIQA